MIVPLSEDDLQIAVCEFLDVALPPDAVYFAVANGGSRNKAEAAKLKRMGVKPGIPDLVVCYRSECLFIELKTAAGVLSGIQKQMHERLDHTGFDLGVCRSVEGVEDFLLSMGIPLRALVSA